MEIKLKNLSGGVFEVAGPRVEFELDDKGKANVAVHVSLSDGTHFHFPDASGNPVLQSTLLPPADYTVVAQVLALTHDDQFGPTYKSSVKVGGTLVATASGSLPRGSDGESDFQAFVLRVS